MAHTTTFSSENIIELDTVIDRFGMSLRQAIMHIFSASKSNWNLFVAVDTSFYGNCVNFAFREELQEEAMDMAMHIGSVSKQLEGKNVKKVIFVQDKILNIVAKWISTVQMLR